jgi:alkaline phosphatase
MQRKSPHRMPAWTQIGRMFALVAVLVASLLPVMPAAAAPNAQAPNLKIQILPINKARFIPGQRFDFRVEVSGELADNTDPGTFSVTINGTPAAQLTGLQPTKTNVTRQSAELTWRNISLNRPGTYTVVVNAGGVVKSATWEVVNLAPPARRAKNVILLIADGMTSEAVTLGRIVSKGLTEGKFNGKLAMDTMQEYGYLSTSGYDSLVTDSANSASAYSTGHKAVVNAMGTYQDNTSNTLDDPRVENVVEILNRRGMAIGIVSTAEVEDATPAAMWGHTRRRSDYQDLIDQLLDDPLRQVDVLMGGGGAYFVPKSTPGSRRTDEADKLADFRNAGYAIIGTRAEMNVTPDGGKILGLFHPSNMNVWFDRVYTKDARTLGPYTDQPTLYEMTDKAIAGLSANPEGARNGFFLMVEAGSVDKQFHPMDWERGIADLIEFDKAVQVALNYAARNPDTLVIATADHGHSLSIYGSYDTSKGPGNRDAVGVYADSKFPNYVDSDGDGFPDNWTPRYVPAVGFANRPDYYDDFIFNPRPVSPTIVDPNNSARYIPNPAKDQGGVLLTGNLPFNSSTEVHTVDDIPLYASGPGATYFNGFHDNTDVFFGMMAAIGAAQAPRAMDGTPLAMGGVVIGLTVVVGASRALRRPGTSGVGPTSYLVRKASTFTAALAAGVRSFRETMRQSE